MQVSNLIETDVIVMGAGVGGYSAAFRAADLGKKVVLIDSRDLLGGVCLQEGCIPSKALLHVADLVDQTKEMSPYGLDFELRHLDIDKIRAWKDNIVMRLTGGLRFLAQRRNVSVVKGLASFVNTHQVRVRAQASEQNISFSNAVIATGSTPTRLHFLPKDPRIIDSTAALDIKNPPHRLLILGGGIIGLEMATIYAAIGSLVTVVEQQEQLIPFADSDLVVPLYKRLIKRMKIHLKTKVTNVVAKEDALCVTLEGDQISKDPYMFDQMLVAIGRTPNTQQLNLDKAFILTDTKGFIEVNPSLQTHASHIYAIGDVIGQPMLAHKAASEGRLAAEIIAHHATDSKTREELIPSVAYTNPAVAWVGLTEHQAKAQAVDYKTGVFPWIASGRAYTLNRTEGLTKLIFNPKTRQLLGAGIVGVHAGDLIAELTLAIRLKATAEQISHTIHPHPTLSESIMVASEVFEGTATDVFMPKKET